MLRIYLIWKGMRSYMPLGIDRAIILSNSNKTGTIHNKYIALKRKIMKTATTKRSEKLFLLNIAIACNGEQAALKATCLSVSQQQPA